MNIPEIPMKRLLVILISSIVAIGFISGITAAAPSYSPDQGKMPLKIQFSMPGGENADSIQWDFGDGKTSSERSPAYTYTTMGFYFPSCVVSLPGATVSYKFDKIVSSNADMPDVDSGDQHYPVETVVDIKPDTLSLEEQTKQGTALYALGLYGEAATSYKKAIQISGTDPDILAQYGTILAGLSQFTDAAQAFNQSLAIRPDPVSFIAYGGILTHMKKYDEALAAFNRSLELDPSSPDAWAGIGQVYEFMKQDADAEAAYKKSLDLDQKDASVWKGYGNVLNAQGKEAESAEAYQKAISLGLSEADIYLKLGGVLRKLGRDGEAQAAMNQAKSMQAPLYTANTDYIPRCTAGGAM